METKYIIYGIIVLVVLFVIVYIKACIDEKKGIDSEEKKQINDIIQKTVPDAESFTPAYAHWKITNYTGGGRTSINTTTRYWYYAIAFKTSMLYVIPLSFDGGDISYGEPMCLTKENVGIVDSDSYAWATFYDLEKKEILTLTVSPSNLKGDKYEPVNIQQKEAAEAFGVFIKEFMAEVNAYHNVPVKEKNGRPIGKSINIKK
ncbi:MAG: hypothetical protein K2G89_10290 [Lachnospiraceae bacterium]|nr:hypothetical protein [Lachnospiraceae bacterium]